MPIDAGSERAVSWKGSVDWKGSRSREARRSLGDMLTLQGLPADAFEGLPFTSDAAKKMVGNAVPLPMGRAIAKAVRRAVYPETVEASA
jgi:site-specific DNA-cytosine methylase